MSNAAYRSSNNKTTVQPRSTVRKLSSEVPGVIITFIITIRIYCPWIAPKQPSRTRLTNYRYQKTTSWIYLNFAKPALSFSTTANTTNNYTAQPWAQRFPVVWQKSSRRTLNNKPWPRTNKHCQCGYATLKTHSQQYTRTESTSSTNTLINRIPTNSSPGKSKKTVKYLF